MNKIKVGISGCLIGQKVRHDGSHRRNRFIVDELVEYFDFTPFCPEVAIGLGVPRPTLRLVENETGIRMVGKKDPRFDVTDEMTQTSSRVVKHFDELSGYILKKDSPSCGLERVRIYNAKGHPEKKGRGLFANKLIETNPSLPVEEEGRLMDPVLRENFIERVFIYHRWQQLSKDNLTLSRLIDFHSRHKLNLFAHSEKTMRRLGKIIATASKENIADLGDVYITELMRALKNPASRKRHTNVLMHIMGYLKNVLTTNEKHELVGLLESYRKGFIPLVVPITLLKHHLNRVGVPYIERQYYMDPYPMELMLRNKL